VASPNEKTPPSWPTSQ